MFSIRAGFLASLAVAASAVAAPALAGSITVSWDATPGASGYYLYYGTQSGNYNPTPLTTSSTTATITGLQDCTNYYVAIKAFNQSGVSVNFSNELSGWSRPEVASATPSSAMQGDQIVVDVMGANFRQGAVVDLGNPHVLLTAVQTLDCNHIQFIATVEPTAGSVRPAQIGRLDLTVMNPPDSVFGMKSQAFEVLINPARFDINQSDATTRNRIDGKDTVYLTRLFGMNESNPNYDADYDFDGNGWIDGDDLLLIVTSNLGRCWSAASKSWSLAACPTAQQ